MDFQMSMFYVFTNSFHLYPGAYQCPADMKYLGESRPYLGAYFLVSGVVLICLYLPCFIVMVKTKCRVPVFQLMMVLAIFDMLSLSVNSVITGILDIIGVSFCHYPLFIFCSGALGLGSWMGGCVACILLGIDRCVEINSKFPLGILLVKKHFHWVMTIILLYWVYGCMFTKPLLFTADYSSWFFDPKVGKDPDLYHNIAHTINNLMVAFATSSLYMYLCYHLMQGVGYNNNSMWMYRSKQQIIIQAVVLCTFHAAAAYIYVYMQFMYAPPFMIIMGQLTWQWSNGCFCVVYLTLNRPIRNAVIRMLMPRVLREKLGLHVGIDEHLSTVHTIARDGNTVYPSGSTMKIDNFS